MIPGELLAHIQRSPLEDPPGILSVEHACQGSKFHSPRPTIVHPFPMPRVPGEIIYLCGTCRDNALLLLQLQRQGEVPWPVKRCFGNIIRAVAAAHQEEDDHA